MSNIFTEIAKILIFYAYRLTNRFMNRLTNRFPKSNRSVNRPVRNSSLKVTSFVSNFSKHVFPAIFFPELKTTGEDRDYSFDVKEPEFVTIDTNTNNVTAVTVGETTVSPFFGILTLFVLFKTFGPLNSFYSFLRTFDLFSPFYPFRTLWSI